LTAIITTLLIKCKASGDTLATTINPKAIASHCEAKIWHKTYEQSWNIDLYADAMTQEQADLEMWEMHWDSEYDGRSLFLEDMNKFHAQDFEGAKERFEIGRVKVGGKPDFLDDIAEVKFISGTLKKVHEQMSTESAGNAAEDADTKLTAEIITLLNKDVLNGGHANDLRNVTVETIAEPIVFFGRGGAITGPFNFGF
jgi:hypothetical protein